MKYYVYILKCSDGSLYTGFTTDPEHRLKMHNEGKGAKYTRSRLPCALVYTEAFEEREEALSREWHIKHEMTRQDKMKMIGEKM